MNFPTIEELAKVNWLYIGGKYDEFHAYLESIDALEMAVECLTSDDIRLFSIGSLLCSMETKNQLHQNDFDGALSFASNLVSRTEAIDIPLKKDAAMRFMELYASLKAYLNEKGRRKEFHRCDFLTKYATSLDPEAPEFLQRILPSYGLSE